ncbi:MAG: zinc metallopeptidase [Paludibacteraceae bacterium]|nr:zinc metallopeptidase [Paludibacteraceae bacterium]
METSNYVAFISEYLYWIIFIGVAIASWVVQAVFERRFERFSKVGLNMTGKEVAELMLRRNGIDDVKVTCVNGHLTDHYNPTNKTVNLSEGVYNSASVAAAAVAAHECGHALQHAQEYAPLQMRSALVPVVNFASQWMTWVLLIGILVVERFPQLLMAGICLFATTTLFAFVTLPVEINASRRAIEWLEAEGITDRETTPMISSALRSAAYTYVIAALSSLATLIYYIIILSGRRK